MAWLFLIVVCGVAALVNLDSYFYRAANELYLRGDVIKEGRRHLFRSYVERLLTWFRRFISKGLAYTEKNPALVLTYTLFVSFSVLFVMFFYARLYPLIDSLYELVGYQIENISIGSRAFRNASLSIAGSITLLITLLGVLLTLIRNLLTRQQNRTDEERLVTEQISRAVEQIGAYKQGVDKKSYEPNIEIRLGGLYSLQRIMKDSARDMLPIAKILYAYVRENVKRDRVKKETQQEFLLPEDVDSALNIISQFKKEWKKRFGESPKDEQLNFSRADFTKYSLKGMDFSNTILEYTNFSDTDLYNANFSDTDLSGANFSDADLYNADFSDADLSGANLSKAYLFRANFSGVNLFHANLSDAKIYHVDLSGVDLSYANLSDANLSWVNLSGADLSGATLSGTNLDGADLDGTDFFNVDLTKTIGLTQENIDKTNGNKRTKLPEGLTRPESWPKEEDDDDDKIPF